MDQKTIVCFEEPRSWTELINELYPAVTEFLLEHGLDPETTAYSLKRGIFCIEFDDPNIALLFKLTLV